MASESDLLNMESYVKDLSSHAVSISGNTYAQNFIQVVKLNPGEEAVASHLFYGVDDDGIVKPLANMSVKDDGSGSPASIDFGVYQDGSSVPVLQVSPDGMTISGDIDVSGGSTVFATSVIEVADIDIVLGSDATELSQLDGGGMIIGNDNSGTFEFKINLDSLRWDTNAGVNLDGSHAFTVGDDMSLDSSGLNFDQLRLTSTEGLVFDDTGLSLTIGSTDSTVLSHDGLVIGSDISISRTTGFSVGSSSFSGDSLSFGSTPGEETTIDDTSISLGSDLILNHDGIYLQNTGSSLYFGPSQEWKITYNNTTQNILFQFYETSGYVTKFEIKSTG